MNYNPEIHQRRATRLPGYDYSQQGAYFVTICAHNRECLFGDVGDGEIKLNNLGQLVYEEWLYTENIRPEVHLDGFVVMPNHLHGIIVILETGLNANQNPIVLGDMLGAFKSISTNKYIEGVRQKGWKPFQKRFWQRDYYEHIIRNERALNAIRAYIMNNPANWQDDKLHPNASPNPFNADW